MSDKRGSPDKRGWIKRILKIDVPAPAPEGVDREGMLVSLSLGDLLREKAYAALPDDVRRGLRKPIEDDIAARKYDSARGSMTHFVADSQAAGRVGTVLEKLGEQIESLNGTGLDTTAAQAAMDSAKQARTAALALSGAARGTALKKVADDAALAVQAADAALDTKSNTGAASGLAEIRKGVAAAIAALPEGDPKKAFAKRLAEWDKSNTAAGKLAKPAEKKAALETLETSATKLLDEALAAAGGTPEQTKDADDKKQAIFKAALEQRFGIKIANTDGTTNTHYDQFYDMMAAVPVQQSQQSSLKILTYDKDDGGAAYGSVEIGGKVKDGVIIMGGKINEDAVGWQYHGKKVEVFKINTLHEIGHAVDDKYGIMSANMGKTGCGGWKKQTVDTVAAAFIADFKKGAGKNVVLADDALLTAVTGALQKAAVKDPFGNTSVPDVGDTDKPAGATDTDWPIVKAMLEKCVKIRSDNWPWGKGQAVVLGGSAWHEAYTGEWVSYDPGARGSIEEVRDYQYRSPAEWFAELYAYTWYKKQEPKGAVASEAAKYMWRPGGGDISGKPS